MFEREEIENHELKAEHERELREAKKIQDLGERLNAEFAINEKYINNSNELSRKHTTERKSIVTGKQIGRASCRERVLRLV